MDFLMRDDAPLSEQEWQAIDEAVLKVARANLVGRRFIRLFGPLGLGVQAVWVDQMEGADSAGTIDVYGESSGQEVTPVSRQMIALNLLYKDFRLFWRDIASARALGAPMDTAPVGAATAMLARTEDKLIFQELMSAKGRLQVAKVGDWDKPGNALTTVAEARQALVNHGAMGPYALALSPDLYARLLRVLGQLGQLELSLVQQVADAGVFQTPVLEAGDGVLVSSGPDVLDLAMAEDMQVAYLGPANMNHSFRVFESVALRVRRPEGICVLA